MAVTFDVSVPKGKTRTRSAIGLQRAMIERRTRCQRCNGKGSYRSFLHALVVCGPCGGTGRRGGAV